MSIYDLRGRHHEDAAGHGAATQPEYLVPAPVRASEVAGTSDQVDQDPYPEISVGSQVFLAEDYYSPADAGMRVFRVLSTDSSTDQCRVVNVDTGALRIIDMDELVEVEQSAPELA